MTRRASRLPLNDMENQRERSARPWKAFLIAVILCAIAYAFVFWSRRGLDTSADNQTIARPSAGSAQSP
jgi:hypothetical protein